MEFGVPAFLWGLPLAGLPVAFHLLMKRRRKRVKFPSLLFLQQADPRLDMKRKLREILLLAARVLLILLLVLALSRPSFENVPGLGQDVELIIAVDNSGSMDASAGAESTKLDVARAGARNLVDSLNPGSRAAVMPLVPEPGNGETPAFHSDPEVLKEQIDDIRRTEATVMTGEFFERIRRISEGMSAGAGKALHVFTDLHEASWDREVGSVKELPEDLDVVFNRISSSPRAGSNVAVDSMQPPEGTVLPGHTYQVGGVLRNTGGRSADVRVRYRDSGGEKTGRRITLPTNSSRVVRFPFKPEEAGAHWYIMTVEGDEFRADNRGAAPVLSQTEGRVVLVGDRSSYGTVPAAISPSGTGRYTSLVPEFRSPGKLAPGNGEDVPLMMVLTWQQLAGVSGEVSKQLKNYLTSGGAVLVLPDVSRGEGEISSLPEWLGASSGPPVSPDEPIVARILNPEGAEWANLWESGTPLPLQFFLVKKYLPLRIGEGFTGLAGPSGKRPLFATRKVDKGRLYVSGFALDRKWTPLVTDPSGLVVVMLHRMATRGGTAVQGPESLSAIAGERVRLPLDGPGQLKVSSLVGDSVNVTLNDSNGPIFPRAGAYRVTAGKRRFYVSVSGARKESTENYVMNDKVPVMGDRDHSVVDFAGDEDIAGQLREHLVGMSLFTPLVILILLVWAFESWLATMLKKRSRKVKDESRDEIGDDNE